MLYFSDFFYICDLLFRIFCLLFRTQRIFFKPKRTNLFLAPKWKIIAYICVTDFNLNKMNGCSFSNSIERVFGLSMFNVSHPVAENWDASHRSNASYAAFKLSPVGLLSAPTSVSLTHFLSLSLSLSHCFLSLKQTHIHTPTLSLTPSLFFTFIRQTEKAVDT